MQRTILIVLSFGLIASLASAQLWPSDEPRTGTAYAGGEGAPYGMGGMPGQERRVDPRQTQRLIERWKASKEAAEREKLETELRALLRREFAARLALHEREIKQLEEKVRQLRERLSLRKEKQEEIVNHRMQQLLREAQGLGWGSEGAGGEAIYHWGTTTDTAQSAANDPFWPREGASATDPAAADDVLGEAVSDEDDLVPNRN